MAVFVVATGCDAPDIPGQIRYAIAAEHHRERFNIIGRADSWDDEDLVLLARSTPKDTISAVEQWLADHAPDAFLANVPLRADRKDPRIDDLWFLAMVIDDPNAALAFKMRFNVLEIV